MCRFRLAGAQVIQGLLLGWVLVLLALPVQAQTQAQTPAKLAMAAMGRSATLDEVKAWDIDVRPDFKGLPKGQGSVRQGESIWDAQCASCHGSFGESSEIFTPIVGGTTAQDMKTGRVAGLLPGSNQPQRTTLMKLSTLSTLWDYINRAMPWNAPKSLTANEVYAVTAYILSLGNILPTEFTLSDGNIREVQARLPNRGGMTTAHAMWPDTAMGGTAKPDVQGSACMRDCAAPVVVTSFLPDYARNAHGNLAEQFRKLGASRGADTTATGLNSESKLPLAPAGTAQSAIENIVKPSADANPITQLLEKNACLACHAMDSQRIGPSFRAIASKYKGHSDGVDVLSGKIRSGGQGVWGAMAMPAQALSLDDSAQLAQWLMQGMPQ